MISAATITACVAAGGVPSAAAAPHESLTKAQVNRIVRFTGYENLRSHHFDVADRFRAGAAHVKVVRLDGARLGVSQSELRRDIAAARSFAERGGTFTSTLKIGHGPKQRIKYIVSPSAVPGRANSRYVIFTPRNEHLNTLTQPQRVPSIQAFTVIHGSRPLTVTLLHNRAPAATLGKTGLRSGPLCAMIESINALDRVRVAPATLRRLARQHVDMSYLTDINHQHPSRHRQLVNLAARGYEIWSNSLGFAVVSARTGASYRHYLHRIARLGFDFYKRNEMHYLKFDAQEYRQFSGI